MTRQVPFCEGASGGGLMHDDVASLHTHSAASVGNADDVRQEMQPARAAQEVAAEGEDATRRRMRRRRGPRPGATCSRGGIA